MRKSINGVAKMTLAYHGCGNINVVMQYQPAG